MRDRTRHDGPVGVRAQYRPPSKAPLTRGFRRLRGALRLGEMGRYGKDLERTGLRRAFQAAALSPVVLLVAVPPADAHSRHRMTFEFARLVAIELKTDESKATLPLLRSAAAMLLDHKARTPAP